MGLLGDDNFGEEGEEEVSENAEEGKDDYVSDISDDEEEAPELVPASKIKGKTINNERKVESESEVSDIDPDDYGSSSDEYDSDDLDPDSTANPHGFVFSNMLETYQKSRKDRILEMKEEFDKEAHRAKFKKKRNSKPIGKKEKIHAKNKPFMMVKKKKINELRDKLTMLN